MPELTQRGRHRVQYTVLAQGHRTTGDHALTHEGPVPGGSTAQMFAAAGGAAAAGLIGAAVFTRRVRRQRSGAVI